MPELSEQQWSDITDVRLRYDSMYAVWETLTHWSDDPKLDRYINDLRPLFAAIDVLTAIPAGPNTVLYHGTPIGTLVEFVGANNTPMWYGKLLGEGLVTGPGRTSPMQAEADVLAMHAGLPAYEKVGEGKAGWISVKDALPDFGTLALIAIRERGQEQQVYNSIQVAERMQDQHTYADWFSHNGERMSSALGQPYGVTHWQPIPTVPQQKGGTQGE